MAGSIAAEILAAYDASQGARADFCLSVERLIRDFLIGEGIRFVDVASRVKTRASLEEKLARKGEGRYKNIADVTDICGVRVITYFEGDVRRVCDILEREFDVDQENSIDKSQPADPDRFGYRSVHFVVSHTEDRNALREYRRFLSFKVEIQIRSILQHAWAEIEHDMGYKSADEVPTPVKRRFSRLAGLLELADEEFMTIRKELDNYEQELIERLVQSSDDIELDADSLVVFVNTDEVVGRIDAAIARSVGAKLRPVSTRSIGRRVSQMKFFDFDYIGEIKSSLSENEALICEVASRWLNREGQGISTSERWETGMQRGTATFYLAYTLLLQSGDRERLLQYADQFFHDGADVADRLLETFGDFPK
ncbi:GTP pyrophosphokinase family protein [Burkholderia contaminans]|uniref:RelA/SpoT domain-containing protein n=1 Tax=Burkholderia contaminans TaxID=488447 RepID=A0A3N8RND0_9BURK|nr:hypothetical protein [Burkholderia contaminans]RQT33446.1 hypothetical protein DF037_07620 [Burkholderia contaminans]